MALDSRLHENKARVVSLNLVMGVANTPKWEQLFNVPYLELDLDGVSLFDDGLDRHHGRSRVIRNYQAGAWAGRIVRNERQVSVATRRDLYKIASNMGIIGILREKELEVTKFMGHALAVNVVVDAEDDLTDFLGPGSKLYCGEPDSGSIIDLSEAHLPCSKPPIVFAEQLGLDYVVAKRLFKESAAESRGYVGTVYSAGRIAVGDPVAIQLPIDHRQSRPSWK